MASFIPEQDLSCKQLSVRTDGGNVHQAYKASHRQALQFKIQDPCSLCRMLSPCNMHSYRAEAPHGMRFSLKRVLFSDKMVFEIYPRGIDDE